MLFFESGVKVLADIRLIDTQDVSVNESLLTGESVDESKESVSKQVDEWAANWFRNIALAYKISDEKELAKDGYVYLGFASITDPLREGVADAVRAAEEAGIEVVMVTGDHPNTAFFIAKELGIALNKKLHRLV